MLNFTVGPVMSPQEVLEVASVSAPYFRTEEFSSLMLENEAMILSSLHAPKDCRCLFLTSSGTGAMEAVVINVLNESDRVICINGGSFGQRFVDLCRLHHCEHTELICEFGKPLEISALEALRGKGYTALLVNMNETSSGIRYDMDAIADFCRDNRIMLIIDAISSFIADPIDMERLGADVILTGSQKALALQPGIAIVALTPKAIERVKENKEKSMYFSFKEALKNMERGQTPYTPAVTILLQLHKRLTVIKETGGILAEQKRIRELAEYFRNHLTDLPLDFLVENDKDRSNAVTALRSHHHKAGQIFEYLKKDYSIWVCPNGGEHRDDIFRVGHIGCLKKNNYDVLLHAFREINAKGCM